MANPSLPSPSPSSSSSWRLTVLVSGNGTNLQSLIDACHASTLPNASIVRVISNRKFAKGLERAQKVSIPTSYHNLLPYRMTHSSSTVEPQEQEKLDEDAVARAAYDADLAKLVLADRPDLVVCAGWMHILSPSFLNPLASNNVPIINLHPALPGKFNGARAIERAWEAGQRGEVTGTGVMIHEVVGEVDGGDPLITKEVEIRKGESLAELEERMHEVEHELTVKGTSIALEKLADRRRKETAKMGQGEVIPMG